MASDAPPRSALYELTAWRVKEALRDPGSLFWTFGFPIGLAIILGLAFRTAPPRPAVVGVACGDIAQALRGGTSSDTAPALRGGTATPGACAALRARLSAQPEIAIQDLPLSTALLQLGRGKLELVLELPSAQAAPAAQPPLIYHFDPTRTEAVTARLAVQVALDAQHSAFDRRDRPRLTPGTRYIDYLMPGIVALNLMGSGVWGIGFAIVESRRRHLMRRLATTPMQRSHYLLSFMFSRLVFLLPEVGLLIAFGVLAFGTPLRGSIAALAVLSLLGSFAFAGIGVLIGSRTQSTEVVAGLANAVLMPMWLCSGVFFRYDTFPAALHPLIRALPLTALSDALRAVVNEAAPLSACATELAVLSVWTVLTFAIALRVFRWR